MTASVVLSAFVALAVAGCGSEASMSSAPTSVAPSTSSTASASTSSPVTPPVDDLLGLEAVSGDIAELPTAEMVDGGCGWVEEAYFVAQVPEVFSGRPVRVGDHGMTPDALGRIVEIDVTEVHVDTGRRIEAGDAVRVFVPDTEIQNGYRVAVPGVDVDQVMARDVVTVFGVPGRGGFVRPVRVFSETAGGLSSRGYCDHQLEVLAEIAERVGAPDALSMFVEFAEANARGEGIAALSDAFEQWRADLDAASAPAPWEDQDPTTRRLDPQTIPSDLLPSLEVVGVSFALDDLGGAAEAVGVRTESGVSYSLIGVESLPFVGPLYFLRDVDETVEVFVQSIDSGAAPQVVGSIGLAAIVDAGGGIEITGSVRDGTVAIATLTREQIADRHGVELDQLDQLRSSFLAP